MESGEKASTSADMPAFHDSPSDDLAADVKYGATDGRYIRFSLSMGERRKSRAISRRSFGTCDIPSSTFVKTMGNTIKNEMNDGRASRAIQSIARIINDATGVALATAIIGDSKRSSILNFAQSAARSVPAMIADSAPANTRRSEKTVVLKKSAVCASSQRRVSVSNGEGSRSAVPVFHAASCQSKTQNRATPKKGALFFMIFIYPKIPLSGTLPPIEVETMP